MYMGLLSKAHISVRFIGSLPPTCWEEAKMQEFVNLLTQNFCLAGTTSGHGLLESLMTTCLLQGQCSSPGLLKLLPQNSKALCYSTGHEISTANSLGKGGLERTCRAQAGGNTAHPGSHT